MKLAHLANLQANRPRWDQPVAGGATAYKTLRISDTEGDDADPRRGPFFAIVAAIEAADRESIREEKANGG